MIWVCHYYCKLYLFYDACLTTGSVSRTVKLSFLSVSKSSFPNSGPQEKVGSLIHWYSSFTAKGKAWCKICSLFCGSSAGWSKTVDGPHLRGARPICYVVQVLKWLSAFEHKANLCNLCSIFRVQKCSGTENLSSLGQELLSLIYSQTV